MHTGRMSDAYVRMNERSALSYIQVGGYLYHVHSTYVPVCRYVGSLPAATLQQHGPTHTKATAPATHAIAVCLQFAIFQVTASLPVAI